MILKVFPESVLGVILFFAGLELAVSIRDAAEGRNYYYIGVGFLAGIVMQECLKRKIFKV